MKDFLKEIGIDEKTRKDILKQQVALNKERLDKAMKEYSLFRLSKEELIKLIMSNSKYERIKLKRYIINKNATILFWSDGDKTIVRRSKEDKYDKVKGFLWAYFQKTSGMSKTKANKYLSELIEE